MARLHLIDGEKGGVGKSLFAATLIQYFLDKKLPLVAVEADRSNPDIANKFSSIGVQFAVFSEDERKTEANHLFDFAIEKPVIVSLPSQVANPLNDWIDAALLDAKEYKVELVRWFVSSGTYESLNLFHNALEKHGGKFPHILVKNLGVGDDWSELSELTDLIALMKKSKVKGIDFPKLSAHERNKLQKHNLTFGEARESKEWQVMSKSRLKIFLTKAYEAIESTKLVP